MARSVDVAPCEHEGRDYHESFPPDVNGVAHCVLRVAELLTSYGHHPLVIGSSLAASGYPVGSDPEPSSPPPTRLAEAGWMATKGTAWLVRRSRDLMPALVGLAVREWLSSGLEGTDQDRSDQGRSEQDHEGRDGAGREPVNLNVLSRPSGNLQLNGGLPLAALKVRNR